MAQGRKRAATHHPADTPPSSDRSDYSSPSPPDIACRMAAQRVQLAAKTAAPQTTPPQNQLKLPDASNVLTPPSAHSVVGFLGFSVGFIGILCREMFRWYSGNTLELSDDPGFDSRRGNNRCLGLGIV